MLKRLRHSTCIALATLMVAQSAYARSFIRDAESEHTLRLMTDPILAAADIESDSVRIFMINDSSINAFVAGGQNIFFHTGLLLKADNAAMLMGVIAHETGHISGAHLTQLTSATNDATLGALLSYILGAAAAIGGSPQAGAAIISGGQNASIRNLLSHYRGNEQQADQAAVRYLRANNLSPVGMLEMFELLRRNERQHIGSGGDQYLRTHPLTTDRIAALRGEARDSKLPAAPSSLIEKRFSRMQAKLQAFLSPIPATLRDYPESDASEAAHLARAVAYFRQPNLQRALQEVDALIALSPQDAYNYDLKGQILFENGQIAGAIAAYEEANRLAPRNGLILTDLGKAYLAAQDKPRLDQAIRVLERAARLNNPQSTTHRQLAIAYGKRGEMGKSYLSLAREAALQNEPDLVIRYAKEAKMRLKDNDILTLQADDLIADAERVKKEEDKS